MDGLLAIENWFTLLMLILLQAVLGFDNLLYISLEAGKTPPENQRFVRRMERECCFKDAHPIH